MNKSVETRIGEACQSVGTACAQQRRSCEESVRNAPWTSILIALVGGWILQKLPLTCIVGRLVKTVLWLLKPALFVYAGAKAIEVLQSSGCCQSEPAPRPAPRKKKSTVAKDG